MFSMGWPLRHSSWLGLVDRSLPGFLIAQMGAGDPGLAVRSPWEVLDAHLLTYLRSGPVPALHRFRDR